MPQVSRCRANIGARRLIAWTQNYLCAPARRESGCLPLAGEGPCCEPSGLDPSGGTHLLTLLRAAVIARGRRQLQYGGALTGD
jgi:hypothetical protein